MNYWLETSSKNLVPLSKAEGFAEALREWYFTGDVEDCDDEDELARCELCQHPDLVHRYHIKNAHTGHALLVGSSCILKFREIEIRDQQGKAIADPIARKAALDAALRAKIIESALVPLRSLWKVMKGIRLHIEHLAQQIREDRGLEPNDLVNLLIALGKRQIPYRAALYKVSLRSGVAQSDIASMSKQDFDLIVPALSKAQLVKVRAWRR